MLLGGDDAVQRLFGIVPAVVLAEVLLRQKGLDRPLLTIDPASLGDTGLGADLGNDLLRKRLVRRAEVGAGLKVVGVAQDKVGDYLTGEIFLHIKAVGKRIH